LDNVIQHFPTAEGYASRLNLRQENGVVALLPSTELPIDFFTYVYNYTDHLRNIRLSYAQDPDTQQLKIVEQNHYYPFGLRHTNYSGGKMQVVKEQELKRMAPTPEELLSYKYKYNGKEWQDELGLNMYDYGARNYAPDAPRFWQIDPKAEKYYSISPTVYVADNPVNAIDPTGEEIIFIVRGETRKQDQTFTYRKGNFYHADGKRYNPKKEAVSKTMYKVLSVYRQIEKSGDKSHKDQLKTLEKSDKKHYIEQGSENEVKAYDPSHAFISETKEAVKNGESIGTQTTFDFSESSKKDFKETEGIPNSEYTTVVHELQHQYDYDQGNMADSQGKSGASDPAEKRAVESENKARKALGLPKRTTYGGEPIDDKKP
jgi:RHS repeat-associated protein